MEVEVSSWHCHEEDSQNCSNYFIKNDNGGEEDKNGKSFSSHCCCRQDWKSVNLITESFVRVIEFRKCPHFIVKGSTYLCLLTNLLGRRHRLEMPHLMSLSEGLSGNEFCSSSSSD